MKRILGVQTGVLAMVAPAVLALSQVGMSQVAPATVHGKVVNPAGAVMKTGEVKLTLDKTSQPKDRKYLYTFPIDANGMYKGSGVAPGDYLVIVSADDKTVDFQSVTVKAGEDRTIDFDMTRAEYLKALTPEERAAIEENKKKNAGVVAENAKIANINQTLLQARADEKAGKADDAVAALTPLTQAKPDEPVIWASLGEAQLAVADAAAKAARAAKTSPMDVAIVQKYADAAASYQKAVDLNTTSKKPNPEMAASSYLNMGQAYGRSGKIKEAGDAYESAVKASPTMASSAYYNEAATFFNAGKSDEAAAAADKAIAADPKRAEAYYIKGQSLIGKATMDPKTNKFQAPPGCIEAYQEYLELEPNGAHSQDVKELLTNLGQPVKNSFKAGKK